MIIKCKMCGGDLQPIEGAVTCECEFCGTTQTVPVVDNEKKANLFNRANRLRMSSEFDRAAAVYESIVAEFPEEAEGYWGLLLCKYGIEYVDDPATGKKVPTCHRTNSVSIMEDDNYNRAWDCADVLARKVYREEAKAIDQLQQSILAIVQKEEPYDVFICYKETGADGQRTEDSVLAQEIYDALTTKGMKVFFARITLEDKLGQQYEPYIYAALHSAKVMLAVGTSFEHYDAVWVKNEWSRFLAMATTDKEKVLIPCYKHVDAYDMPKEFRNLQAQDMSKIGWLQDLTRGVEKLCGKNLHGTTVVQQVAQQRPSAAETVEALLRRAFLFLESKDWKSADEYCERVLDAEPENARAYLGKLMAQQQVSKAEDLAECKLPFDESDSYQKAYRFAGSNLKADLDSYAKVVRDRLHREKIAALYDKAEKLAAKAKKPKQCLKAAELYKQAGDYKDAAKKEYECRQKAKVLKKRRTRRRIIFAALVALAAAIVAVVAVYVIPDQQYKKAEQLLAEEKYDEAAVAFYRVGDFSDARSRSKELFYKEGEKQLAAGDELQAYAAFLRAMDYKDARVKARELDFDRMISIDHYGNVYCLQSDGTVLVTNSSVYLTSDVYRKELQNVIWSDIIAVSAGSNHAVGLRADGTVVSTGSNEDGKSNVSGWTNIVAVSAGAHNTVGLKADGTVVVAGADGFDQCQVEDWTDIVQVVSGDSTTFGLKADGTVLIAGQSIGYAGIGKWASFDVSTWTDIVSIAANSYQLVGLKPDGSIVWTGLPYEDRTDFSHGKNYDDWQGIAAIDGSGTAMLGLRADGTVVAAYISMNNETRKKLTEFQDIAVIAVGSDSSEFLAMKADGTLMTTSSNRNILPALSTLDLYDPQQ